jgi:hypothetical protein
MLVLQGDVFFYAFSLVLGAFCIGLGVGSVIQIIKKI